MVARIVVLVLSGLMMTAPSLNAHPLHVTYADVRREQGGFIAMSVRLFADDFGALVDSLSRTSPGQPKESIAQRYVQRSLTLSLGDGSTIATDWCGMRSDENLVWVCVKSASSVMGRFRLRNALMFDRFSDQVSIIRWTGQKKTRTLVLSSRAPEGTLD
jgi:hypothetical protein